MAFLPYPPTTVEAAIAVLKQDVEITHDIVHGDNTTNVDTESGLVPSFSKLVKTLTDEVEAATGVDTSLRSDLANVDSNVSIAGVLATDVGRRYTEEVFLTDFKNLVVGTDWTAAIQAAINTVGLQDPFSADAVGVTINFPSKQKLSVTGKILIPSYVRLNLNGCTLKGNGTNVMFETAYWSGGSLVTNFGQPNETRFVVNSQITNGRISNCNGFRLFNFCESSLVENIRFFGCNQAVYALRCFYGSFKQLHARSPLDGLVSPCFHFDSAMGALEAAQVYANGYQRGLLVSGNKDNMVLSNFSAESCPIGISVENATSAVTFERGYFEDNYNSISLASTANHENVVVDGCWFSGTTNALEALTVLSGVWRQNNVMNGANLSLQNNFSCRMTVEIPTDVTANNAVYGVPSNYLLGTANNVEYIKQVYDTTTGLVEFKSDVHVGPIPHSYGGTSGKLIQGQIPFCVSTLTATTLTIDTKIVYQSHEFIGIYVNVNSLSCGGTVLAGQMLNTIPSTITITPSNNGGFYRFVISGFTGGSTFSGSVRIL